MRTHWFTQAQTGAKTLVVLGLAALLANCQSARSSYYFQPGPRTVAAAVDVRPTPTPTEVLGEAVAPAEVLVLHPAVKAQRRQQRRWHRGTSAARVTPTAFASVKASSRRLAQRHPQRMKPLAPAEAGLGTTVLGMLGLVALPVGLLGLVLGGGLVWGIVAGLGAVAVLVAYLDPDKR